MFEKLSFFNHLKITKCDQDMHFHVFVLIYNCGIAWPTQKAMAVACTGNKCPGKVHESAVCEYRGVCVTVYVFCGHFIFSKYR